MMAVGSNWSVIRMGLLCGIAPSYVTTSYTRNLGIALGFCSGSWSSGNPYGNRTWCGAMLGSYILTDTGWTSQYVFTPTADATSGSYYTMVQTWLGGHSAGVEDANSSINLSTGTGVTNILPNQMDPKQRRFPLIVEISASSTTNMQVKMFALPQQTLINGDYTATQLISALVNSVQVTGITCSFTQAGTASFVQKTLTNVTHDKVAYPMDTAFIDVSGAPAFEVYDWYIYKVR